MKYCQYIQWNSMVLLSSFQTGLFFSKPIQDSNSWDSGRGSIHSISRYSRRCLHLLRNLMNRTCYLSQSMNRGATVDERPSVQATQEIGNEIKLLSTCSMLNARKRMPTSHARSCRCRIHPIVRPVPCRPNPWNEQLFTNRNNIFISNRYIVPIDLERLDMVAIKLPLTTSVSIYVRKLEHATQSQNFVAYLKIILKASSKFGSRCGPAYDKACGPPPTPRSRQVGEVFLSLNQPVLD